MNRYKTLTYYLRLVAIVIASQNLLVAQPIVVDKVIMHRNQFKNWVETEPDPAAASDPTPINPNAKSGKVIVFKRGTGNSNASPLPAVYVSGSKAEVSATFLNTGDCTPKSIFIKGEATIGSMTYHLPVKALKLKNNECTYPATAFREAFPEGLVMCNESFIITWNWTDNPEAEKEPEPSGIEWSSAGESTCFVMVTHDKPKRGVISTEEGTTLFLSSIYISCKAADGLITADEDEVTMKIFDAFRTRAMKKYQSQLNLKYWGGDWPDNGPRGLANLLHYRDLNCQEWVGFFQDMLKIHGIAKAKFTLLTWQDKLGDLGVLKLATFEELKDDCENYFGSHYSDKITWDRPLNNPISTDVSAYFFIKTHNFSPSNKFYIYNLEHNSSITFLSEFTIDGNIIKASNPLRDGVEGQGNDDPRSYFDNHVILTYEKDDGSIIYLDPSYGTSYNSKSEYENASISGFGTMFFYETNPANQSGKYIIWLKQQTNSTTQELKFD